MRAKDPLRAILDKYLSTEFAAWAKRFPDEFYKDDIGHPALAQHRHAVIGFMRASTGWDDFIRLLDRAFPRKGHTIPMLLE